MNRREFLAGLGGFPAALPRILSAQPRRPGMRFVDVTEQAGLTFQHNNGAFGGKLLPETLGSGCAFLDYDADGWQDILFVNGMDWPGHKRTRSTLQLYRNNRDGTFADVTKSAGLDVEMYGMGVAVGDFNNDGFPDLLVTCVGQNRLFRNTGKGTFLDVTRSSGLQGRQAFSTSALWVDIDRDGFLDLFVCNYVRWSPESDVFCSLDGKQKSYCTPEAYRGETCWLFRNNGNGTFTDVTASSGVFDTSSKSLGVATIDDDADGWPDLFVANDTQPNKLYRNQKNGTFKEGAVEAGLALSRDGKARAGMGVDAADLDGSGRATLAVTNFDNEMIGLYRPLGRGLYEDAAMRSGIGTASRNSLGFGCVFADVDLDGALDLVVANGHIDETVRNIRGNAGYAQAPHLFLNRGDRYFSRCGRRRRRGVRASDRRARPRMRRLRSGRRRGFAADDQQRSGSAVPKRPRRRQPQPPVSTGRHEIESRRYRRDRPDFSRRHVAVAPGQERFQLSVTVGAAGDLRRRNT